MCFIKIVPLFLNIWSCPSTNMLLFHIYLQYCTKTCSYYTALARIPRNSVHFTYKLDIVWRFAFIGRTCICIARILPHIELTLVCIGTHSYTPIFSYLHAHKFHISTHICTHVYLYCMHIQFELVHIFTRQFSLIVRT